MIGKALTKSGKSLQSLCNDNNIVADMGASRPLLLPHLKGRKKSSTKTIANRGIVGISRAAPMQGGDYTLRALGIADSNVGPAVSVLVQMVLTHCALALVGLVINGPGVAGLDLAS